MPAAPIEVGPIMIPPGGIRGKIGAGGGSPEEGLHSLRMDPLDHLRALPDAMPCSVCGERVPGDGVRLLAWRDEIAFVQLDCLACLSTTLGFAIDGRPEDAGAERDPWQPPVSADDVLDMHQFLAGWRGDLASLLRTRTR